MYYRITDRKRLSPAHLWVNVYFWETEADHASGKLPIHEEDFVNDCLRLYPSYERVVSRLNRTLQAVEYQTTLGLWKVRGLLLPTDVLARETVAFDIRAEVRRQIEAFIDQYPDRIRDKVPSRTDTRLRDRAAAGVLPDELRTVEMAGTR